MSEIVFKAIELIIMICAMLLTRYLVPYIKQTIGYDRIDTAGQWIKCAVLFAQQTMWAKPGTERKKYVAKFITDLCEKYKIPLTEEQIDVLIEAAVKEMKIEDAKRNATKITAPAGE